MHGRGSPTRSVLLPESLRVCPFGGATGVGTTRSHALPTRAGDCTRAGGPCQFEQKNVASRQAAATGAAAFSAPAGAGALLADRARGRVEFLVQHALLVAGQAAAVLRGHVVRFLADHVEAVVKLRAVRRAASPPPRRDPPGSERHVRAAQRRPVRRRAARAEPGTRHGRARDRRVTHRRPPARKKRRHRLPPLVAKRHSFAQIDKAHPLAYSRPHASGERVTGSFRHRLRRRRGTPANSQAKGPTASGNLVRASRGPHTPRTLESGSSPQRIGCAGRLPTEGARVRQAWPAAQSLRYRGQRGMYRIARRPSAAVVGTWPF